MLDRSLCFAIGFALSALSTGCLLDAGAYSTNGNGNSASSGSNAGGGGQGGTTSDPTTTSPSAGGSGGSGGSTATTPPECDSQDDCVDDDPCTTDVCDFGTCKHPPSAPGTLVADDAGDDCIETVCDASGAVIEGPDDDDEPPPDDNECDAEACNGGMVTHSPTAEGSLCVEQPEAECQENVCVAGQCMQQSKPNDTRLPDDNDEDCASLGCFNGLVYYFAHDELCPDANPTNCFVAKCSVNGGGGFCYGGPAPAGMACVKGGGGNGTCNNSGGCF